MVNRPNRRPLLVMTSWLISAGHIDGRADVLAIGCHATASAPSQGYGWVEAARLNLRGILSGGFYSTKVHPSVWNPMKRRPSQKLQKFQRGHATSSARHHSLSFLLFGHFSPGLISLDGQHNCGPTSRLSRRPRHLFAAEYDVREWEREGEVDP